ncbi:MAG: ORF6N domain-containing protein [Candidatus Margulisiibacteriota bacterium]
MQRSTHALHEKQLGRKIYLIRGEKVMLDRDLAILYGVETRRLNEQVKRNLSRFPSDFMFQLTKEEMTDWMSQIAITNSIRMGIRRSFYAFTEHGILMLSSILNSERAIQVNIQIMRTFVKLRQYLATHEEIKQKLEEHDYKINSLVEAVELLLTPSEDENKKRIGFV